MKVGTYMVRNPFNVFDPMSMPFDDIQRVKVDRPAFHEFQNALSNEKGNIAIQGRRGTGKTFLLCDGLRQPKGVSENVIFLSQSHGARSYSEYLTQFMMQFCMHIWKNRFKLPASKLIRLSVRDYASVFDDLKPTQKKFAALYQTLAASDFSMQTRRKSGISTPKVLKAEISDEHVFGSQRTEIQPFECLSLLSEISAYNKDIPTIFVWDDVNHAPEDFQRALIEDFFQKSQHEALRHIVIFSDRLNGPSSVTDNLDGFSTRIELSGMVSADDIHNMFEKYSIGSGFSVPRASSEIIYEFTDGIPRLALAAASSAAHSMKKPGKFNTRDVTRSCLELRRSLRENDSRLQASEL